MEIDLNPDGPHSPERTKEVADLLAECIRFLNYATMNGNGLDDPADVYYILGVLYTGTERFPQLFGNLARLLTAQAATGRLGDNQGGVPTVVATEAGYDLADATEATEPLTVSLKNAQQAIAGLYIRGES